MYETQEDTWQLFTVRHFREVISDYCINSHYRKKVIVIPT